MYKKILAAVDEHLNSEVSARYALEIARTTHSRIYICYIAEKGISEKALKHTEDTIKRLFNKAKDMGLKAESIFDTGDPAEKIGGIVKTEKIDIVFAAARREDIQNRLYTGRTARKLMLDLSCSVALVKVVHMGRIHPEKILVPLKARLDHIDERSYFISVVSEAFGSNIFLFHATKPAAKFFHGEQHLTPVELEERLPRDISRFVECLNKYEVMHEKMLIPGRTGRHITIEAAAKRFDLVIMGASERSFLSSIFNGNPVQEVLRETPCNLIVLKARHENK